MGSDAAAAERFIYLATGPAKSEQRQHNGGQTAHDRGRFRNGDGGQREIVDGQAVVVAGVVDFSPPHPQRAAVGPGQIGDRPAETGRAIGAGVAVERGGAGTHNRRHEIESSAWRNPGGHGAKGVAEAVLKRHRLRTGVSTVAPLLTVVVHGERRDFLPGPVGKRGGNPTGNRAASRRAEVRSTGTDATQRALGIGSASKAVKRAGIAAAVTGGNRGNGGSRRRLPEQRPTGKGRVVGPGRRATGAERIKVLSVRRTGQRKRRIHACAARERAAQDQPFSQVQDFH